MKRIFLFFIVFPIFTFVHSQTVQLHFSYFGNKPYALVIYEGDKSDTIFRGTTTPEGKVTLKLPLVHGKPYIGMARWMITDKQGGGFDMVINNENFSVECFDSRPNEHTIKFINSKENTFLSEKRTEQINLLKKVYSSQQEFPSANPFSPSKEVTKNELKFDSFRVELKKSKLYAAQYMRFTNFTNGINDKIYKSEYQSAMAFDQYLSEQIDWLALYNSNYWSFVIYQWGQMHFNTIKSDVFLVNSTRKMLDKMPTNELYTDFCEKIVRLFTQSDKDELIAELSGEIKRSGRLLHNKGLLIAFTGIQKGDLAPELIGLNSNGNKTSKNAKIILFFESDCEHCKDLVSKALKSYQEVQNNGIQLISVASDINSDIYRKAEKDLPWPDKICDFKGPTGPNFNNYGVVGTPTVFFVDAQGLVKGRFARWEDILALIKKK